MCLTGNTDYRLAVIFYNNTWELSGEFYEYNEE